MINKDYLEKMKHIKKLFRLNSDSSLNTTDTKAMYHALQDPDLEAVMSNDILEDFKEGAENRYINLFKDDMKHVKGGQFIMGSVCNDHEIYLGEEPSHSANVNSFYMQRFTVTEDKFAQLIKRSGKNKILPVTHVSWYDAFIFSLWVNCRLPTEYEWEYAARVQDNSIFICHENQLSEYAWFSDNSKGMLHPPGMLKPNSAGLYDMIGNVWEWCSDFYYDRYCIESAHNRQQITNCYKVNRGGSIHSFKEMCRTSQRFSDPPNYKAPDLGFRLVKEIEDNDGHN